MYIGSLTRPIQAIVTGEHRGCCCGYACLQARSGPGGGALPRRCHRQTSQPRAGRVPGRSPRRPLPCVRTRDSHAGNRIEIGRAHGPRQSQLAAAGRTSQLPIHQLNVGPRWVRNHRTAAGHVLQGTALALCVCSLGDAVSAVQVAGRPAWAASKHTAASAPLWLQGLCVTKHACGSTRCLTWRRWVRTCSR